jgi:hypothetical protein
VIFSRDMTSSTIGATGPRAGSPHPQTKKSQSNQDARKTAERFNKFAGSCAAVERHCAVHIHCTMYLCNNDADDNHLRRAGMPVRDELEHRVYINSFRMPAHFASPHSTLRFSAWRRYQVLRDISNFSHGLRASLVLCRSSIRGRPVLRGWLDISANLFSTGQTKAAGAPCRARTRGIRLGGDAVQVAVAREFAGPDKAGQSSGAP